MNLDEFQNLSKSTKESYLEDATNIQSFYFWLKRAVVFALILSIALLGGCPTYKVYKQGMLGKAELKRAEQNRQISINEAKALKESAGFKADAEIERARGIDEANNIIAESLGGHEGYLRYLYIDALKDTSCSTIYVPTEAGLPILEAGKR